MLKTDVQTLSSWENKFKKSFLTLSLIMVGATACESKGPRPNLDLVLAREAFSSASEVEAAKYAPNNFHKAEESYRQGMAFYKKGQYDDAIKHFRVSRVYAERAENAARVQRQKAGEEGL